LIPALILLAGPNVAAEEQPASGAWDLLRTQWYGDRSIGVAADDFLQIEVPANTPDPAATPVSLRLGDAAKNHIKRLQLVIDNNPSPLAVSFDFEHGTPIRQIDLRVRVDRYTSVRAIAESEDGKLSMRSRWVKASGGCSAPPGAAERGTLGEIRFRPSSDAKFLQVSIRHPNNSGFQIDPRSGEPIPAHYISQLLLRGAGQVLLKAEMGISVSENPSLRIGTAQPLPVPLTVEAEDSNHTHFTASWSGAASDLALRDSAH